MVPTRRQPTPPLSRCATPAFLFLSLPFLPLLPLVFPLSLPRSLTVRKHRADNFSLYDAALRANGRGSSREKWTRGCLMAPRRRRYRFIRATSTSTPSFTSAPCAVVGRRGAIERNARDVRNVGYFPVRRIVSSPLLPSSFFFSLSSAGLGELQFFRMHEIARRPSLPAKCRGISDCAAPPPAFSRKQNWGYRYYSIIL